MTIIITLIGLVVSAYWLIALKYNTRIMNKMHGSIWLYASPEPFPIVFFIISCCLAIGGTISIILGH